MATTKKRQGKYLIRRPAKKAKPYTNKTVLLRPVHFERKWRHVGYAPTNLNSSEIYCVNPLYFMTSGSSQDQRVGLNISDVNLWVTVKYAHWGSNNTGGYKFSNSRFRCLVISSPSEWRQTTESVPEKITAGTGQNLLASDIFMDSGLDRCTQSFVNKDTIKLLKDCKIVAESNVFGNNYCNGNTEVRQFKIKLGDIRFKYNTQSYIRDNQIYLLFVADMFGFNQVAVADPCGSFACNILTTYRDS